jgi:hypothetical protein
MFDYFTDLVGIEKHIPVIGDMGSSALVKAAQQEGLNYGYLDGYALEAFEHYGDTKFAQAAQYGGSLAGAEGLADPQSVAARAREAALKAGPHVRRDSQVMDGYKLAFLREGEGDNQRALWSYYGATLAHGQPDPLMVGLFAKGLDLLPGIGYPQSWKDAGVWEGHVLTHNTVCVDQGNPGGAEGRMLGFVKTPVVQWMQLDREGVAPGVDLFRRTLVTVKLNDREGYAVDLFEVHGGSEHHLSYHGPQADVTTEGLDLQAQAKGTLAGEDVEFSQAYTDAKGNQRRDPFCQLTNVQRARPTEAWAVDYACGDSRDVHLRLHGVPGSGDEIILADGRGATHPEAYTSRFVLNHRQGPAPLSSQFLTVLEPYEEKPFITSVERLPVDVDSRAVVLRVETAEGVDILILNDDPNRELRLPGSRRFRGRCALLRVREEQRRAVALVGATSYTEEDFSLKLADSVTGGKIIAVDREKQTVDLDWRCPEPKVLIGRTVRFSNDQRSCVYTITAAQQLPRGTRLKLNTSSLVGEGAMTGTDDYVIHNSAAFFFGGLEVRPDGTRAPGYRLYVGATLENEDGSVTFPVEGVTGGGYWGSPGDVYLDRKREPDATAAKLKESLRDTSGDGLASFRIYDYGVGDAFEFVHSASFEVPQFGPNGEPRLMNVETTTGLELSVAR